MSKSGGNIQYSFNIFRKSHRLTSASDSLATSVGLARAADSAGAAGGAAGLEGRECCVWTGLRIFLFIKCFCKMLDPIIWSIDYIGFILGNNH